MIIEVSQRPVAARAAVIELAETVLPNLEPKWWTRHRLDLGPSRGLTSSVAGRPGACPMSRASLRALALGQAGVALTV
jgi:hypothetical protein